MTWKVYHRPTDSAGSVPDEGTASEIKETESPAAPLEDPLAKLKDELAAAKGELAQCQDRFLRKAAEFENYRKRTDKDRIESATVAKSSILMEILPVADACERALKSMGDAKEDERVEKYREGVLLLYGQVNAVLNRVGVTAIEAKGQKFDPHVHEAVLREETTEHEDNTVLLELKRGYLFKDRLLRPAQVIVAVRPQATEKAGS
jgi:molecular chaperone GrpE